MSLSNLMEFKKEPLPRRAKTLAEVAVDIIRGKHSFEVDGITYWARHRKFYDDAHLDLFREQETDKLKREGLWVTEESQLEIAREAGTWTTEDEKALEKASRHLESLETTLTKLVIEAQRKQVAEQIRQARPKVKRLSNKRREAIGMVSSDVVAIEANKLVAASLIYRDENLTLPVGELGDGSLVLLAYMESLTDFTETRIENAGLGHHLRRMLNLCEGDVSKILPFSMSEATNWQIRLFECAKIAIKIHEYYHPVPEHCENDYAALLKHMDDVNKKKEKAQKAKSQGEIGGRSLNSREEVQKALKSDPQATTPAMMLAKNGGKPTSMKDLL